MVKIRLYGLVAATIASAFAEENPIVDALTSLQNTNTSLYIYDIKKQQAVINHHTDILFIPASVQKIATAYAALEILGEQYRFNTDMQYQGKIEHESIQGDLWLDFSGDPTLRSSDIDRLFATLTAQHIHHIEGNLYIKNNTFDSQPYGPGWMWDELDDCYAAPIASTIIDGNCATARIKPNKSPHHQALFSLESELDQPVFHHIDTISDNKQRCTLSFKRYNPSYYFLTGCIPVNSPPQKLEIAAHDPNSHAIKKIQHALTEQGITLKGSIQFNQQAHSDKKRLARHQSAPLKQIITKMLKDSDNLIAESLFKKVGRATFNQPGSWDNGHEAVSYIMAKHHLPFSDSQLQDGSGLSRYNLLSSKQVMSLLLSIHHDNRYGNTLIESLPIAGVDGTLKWMRSPALQGHVQAKSGSMTGVYNLAGYFSTVTSDYAFVMFINGPPEQRQLYKKTAEKALNTAILSL
jgi:D-alanyl-D-alanine carboxypeptidase/D-alanyl-D-alanine-endopeptidase (penicillin-binding protein 4)